MMTQTHTPPRPTGGQLSGVPPPSGGSLREELSRTLPRGGENAAWVPSPSSMRFGAEFQQPSPAWREPERLHLEEFSQAHLEREENELNRQLKEAEEAVERERARARRWL